MVSRVRGLLLSLFAFSSTQAFCEIPQASQIQRWDRTVCLASESSGPQGKMVGDLGSGFIVDCQSQFVLVTAAHVSNFTNSESRLLFRNSSGDSRWLSMGALYLMDGSPWLIHKNLDLATMSLSMRSLGSEIEKWLREISIPLSALSLSTPKRTTKVEVSGFPLSLGVSPLLSPLVMVATVCSREIEMDTNWGKERIYVVGPVVGDGTSGG